ASALILDVLCVSSNPHEFHSLLTDRSIQDSGCLRPSRLHGPQGSLFLFQGRESFGSCGIAQRNSPIAEAIPTHGFGAGESPGCGLWQWLLAPPIHPMGGETQESFRSRLDPREDSGGGRSLS